MGCAWKNGIWRGLAAAGLLALLLTVNPGEETRSAQAADPCLFSQEAAAAGLTSGYLDPPLSFFRDFDFPTPVQMGSGVAVGDVTGNGYDDVYIASGQENHLYFNEGGSFSEVTEAAGVQVDDPSFDAIFFDYDGDGHLDLFVTGYGQNRLFRNTGESRFEDVTEAAGLKDLPPVPSYQVSAADYNGSGYLDLFIANFGDYARTGPPTGAHSNQLLRNNGDGTFTDVTEEAGLAEVFRWSIAAGWGDLTNNGLPDLYVANDFDQPNELYLNNGDGTFTRVPGGEAAVRRNSMNVEFADFNENGYLDIYVTNIYDGVLLNRWSGNNMLMNQDGSGTFVDMAPENGTLDTGWGWSGIAFDHDLNSYLDLFVTNGMVTHQDVTEEYVDYLREFETTGRMPFSWDWRDFLGWVADSLRRLFTPGLSPNPFWFHIFIDYHKVVSFGDMNMAGDQPDRFFVHSGETDVLWFDERGEAACLDSRADGRGVGMADFNGSGAVDLVVSTRQGLLYYRNRVHELGTENDYLQIRLRGEAPNPHAVGARIYVERNDGRRLMRELTAGSAYLSQKSLTRTIGLGVHPEPVRVTVRWPDGLWEVWDGVDINRLVELDRGSGTPSDPAW